MQTMEQTLLAYRNNLKLYMFNNDLNVAKLALLCNTPYQATNNVITGKTKPSLQLILDIYNTTGINFIE